MKIVILSRSTALYSTQSLVRACMRRGHEVEIIDHLSLDLLIKDGDMQIKSNGYPIGPVDAIIPRIGSSVTTLGTSIIRQFELMNIFSATGSDALMRSRDKLSCLQMLASKNIPIPDTMIMNYLSFNQGFFKSHMKLPVIIKLLDSTHGLGVIISNSVKSTESTIETLYHLKQKAILQQYIRESSGSDLRIFVVDGKVVAAMQRIAAEGEFRSNLHRGGTSRMVRLTDQEMDDAVRSAEILGLGIAGVDMLRGKDRSFVIEVNASPGLEGIEGTTGVNIASKIVEYVEKGYHNQKEKGYANRSV
ncbi:ATP-grasp domain-containing protein [Membranihabitans maritimus]|uniref:ATP-grasp domain-containing protein n=1 Tax=Membranihabitans maritimus TaxID=2904244 RepID=UPI001EFF82D2|nr:RimK family alpha-L-glutamate ligase [Membranihabitans maritimus]